MSRTNAQEHQVWWLLSALNLLGSITIAYSEIIDVPFRRLSLNSSELSIIRITPEILGWMKTPGSFKEIEYNIRQKDLPDLPGWLQYTYDGHNSIGFLYGVAPNNLDQVVLDAIGWHRRYYIVGHVQLGLEIIRKASYQYTVQIKIDNLNVKDLCTIRKRRLNALIDIFNDQFGWTMKGGSKIVPTFMESAVVLGENRVPLNPRQADGVVVQLSSDKEFPTALKKLQTEVSPLWKLRPCPRNMKRTSVERHFRKINFLMDWCAFRLIETSPPKSELEEDLQSHQESVWKSQSSNNYYKSKLSSMGVAQKFRFYKRSTIPDKAYTWDLLWAMLLPACLAVFFATVIFSIFWEDTEYIDTDDDGTTDSNQPIMNKDCDQDIVRHLSYDEVTNQYVYHKPDPLDYKSDDDSVIMLSQRQRSVEPHCLGGEISVKGSQFLEVNPLPPPPPKYGSTASMLAASSASEIHPNGEPARTYAV